MATQHLDLDEQEQLDQLKAFWKQYGNFITWGLTLVLLAYAAWSGWTWWQREQSTKASAIYDELDRFAQMADADKVAAVLGDLKDRFPRTSYAAQGALLAAKVQLDKGQLDAAGASLAWAAENASEDEFRDIARLRMAGLQFDAKQYDEAGKSLDAVKSSGFAALVADRRGDLLVLQAKPDLARAEYQKAYDAMDKAQEYRRLIGVKLGQLGVAVPDENAGSNGVAP